MSNKAITTNDLKAVLDVVLPPQPSEYKKLLWTNPSPTSAFAAQTIPLDLSNYDAIEIIIRSDTANTYTLAPIVTEVGKGGIAFNSTAYNSGRQFTTTTSGITFTGASYYSAYGNWSTTSTNALIPVKIYGIKYERVAPPQAEIADYIVEQGTSGIWTYRKWNSGIAECWGTHSGTASVSTAWGYTYYGSMNMPDFPSIFIATPSRQATLSTPGGMAWLVPNSSGLSSTSPGGMYIFSGSNIGSVSCTISVYAIGRWK